MYLYTIFVSICIHTVLLWNMIGQVEITHQGNIRFVAFFHSLCFIVWGSLLSDGYSRYVLVPCAVVCWPATHRVALAASLKGPLKVPFRGP